jgi:4,5-DOPA dioxygenase extradiol
MIDKASVLFIPHGGGPLPLLDEASHLELNRFLRGYRETIEKPDAIIIISAHWEAETVSITAHPKPELIFDYYGFPDKSYQYEYPAPGSPKLASDMQILLRKNNIDCALNFDRGFDHGVFIPLMLMYPDVDIPCIQLSLSSSLDASLHIEIGEALNSLQSRNLLILGSGFSFHNISKLLGKMSRSNREKNDEFEAWLKTVCCDSTLTEVDRKSQLGDWLDAPNARFCHPREEHLLPLHVCYGFAGTNAEQIFSGDVYGASVSAFGW